MNAAQAIFFFGSSGGGANNIVLMDDFVSGATIASWGLGADGFEYEKDTTGASRKDSAWLNPQIGMNQYQVKAHKLSGAVPSGTLDAWLDLGTIFQGWGVSTSYAPVTSVLEIKIRRKSDSVELKTVTVTLEASGLA